jgi:hypothetical protein
MRPPLEDGRAARQASPNLDVDVQRLQATQTWPRHGRERHDLAQPDPFHPQKLMMRPKIKWQQLFEE